MDGALLLDLLGGGLSPAEEQALRARLAVEPGLAREHAALERLGQVSRRALTEPSAAPFARRLALRVREQVSREGQGQQQDVERVPSRWATRTFARVLLASLAVHVLVLGWVLLREPPPGREAARGPVGVAVVPAQPREPAHYEDLAAPPEFGPMVAAELVPDALLERRGLESLADPGADERLAAERLVAERWVAEPLVRVAEHPWPVQFDMLARSRAGVRRGRLTRSGVDAGQAIASVTAGLKALAARQQADGSFPQDLTVAAAQRAPYGPVGLTALALLPFLAEGRRSTAAPGEPADPVVARGVDWLRRALAQPADQDSAPSASDRALGLLALAEDYMLCYGRFDPALASRRGGELADFVQRLGALQAPDGSYPGTGATRLWPLLALDAVLHTGVVSGAGRSLARLTRWLDDLPQDSAGLPLGADGLADAALAAGRMVARGGLAGQGPAVGADRPADRPAGMDRPAHMGQPDGLGAHGAERARVLLVSTSAAELSPTSLATGLALYRRHPVAFGVWNRTQAAAQIARLGPAGVVMRGDPVADTALVLLALQSAYRAY